MSSKEKNFNINNKSAEFINKKKIVEFFRSIDVRDNLDKIANQNVKTKKYLSDFSKDEILKYRSTSTTKPVIHIGQLKLFLTEMEFLNDVLPAADSSALVVYAGSAPSMHLPFLLELFPNVKFILVDPNEHVFHFAGKKSHYELFGKTEANKFAYLQTSAENRYNYKNRIVNVVDEGGKIIKFEKKDKEIYPPSIGGNKRIYDEKLSAIAADLLKSTFDVLIIEDLFGPEVAAFTKNVFNILNKEKVIENYYFWSDIRTSSTHIDMLSFVSKINNIDIKTLPVKAQYITSFEIERQTKILNNMESDDLIAPLELDILWNCAQQYNWLRIMRPNMSMLKFRCPFFDPKQIIINEKMCDLIPYKNDLHAAKSAGINFIDDFKNMKFNYMKPTRICLQAYAGRTSTESRLYIDSKDIDKIVPYNTEEYENKFFYYNSIQRGFGYHNHPVIVDTKDKNYIPGFDHCGDCSIFHKIFEDYKNKASSKKGFDTAAEMKRLLFYIGRSMIVLGNFHGYFLYKYKSKEDILKNWMSYILSYDLDKF
jgi:hypothetical protein